MRLSIVAILLICFSNAPGQTLIKEINLYEGVIPNAKPVKVAEQRTPNGAVDSLVSKITIPTLTMFKPARVVANAPAVIICPGGGYQTQLFEREGRRVARAFNQKGVVAFVLKYRLPDEALVNQKWMVPLMDAQQAILKVRQHATEWGINANAIGIMGFSAGGHLAVTIGTRFDSSYIANSKNTSLRPDFMILINPVISFSDSIGHFGSRRNLLGDALSERWIRFFSAEQNISSRTPPTFLAHAADDKVVPLANSLDFFSALRSHKVPVELHVYAAGDHGFLNDTPPFEEWFNSCLYWMKSTGWLSK